MRLYTRAYNAAGIERVFELSGHGLKMKPVAAPGTFRGPQGRRLAFTIRTFSTLLGRGWCIDLTEEGLMIARKPTEARSPGTVEIFYTTSWFRGHGEIGRRPSRPHE